MDDLPAVENTALKLQHGLYSWVKWVNLNEIPNAVEFILSKLGTKMRVNHEATAPAGEIIVEQKLPTTTNRS